MSDCKHERRFEHLAAFIHNSFNCKLTRTRDAIQIDIQSDDGVVVLLTPQHIEVRLPTVDWTKGSHGPVPSSILWKRRKLNGFWGEGSAGVNPELKALILEGIERRQSQFKKCRFCKQLVSIEHRIGTVCHGCASKHLGIVY